MTGRGGGRAPSPRGTGRPRRDRRAIRQGGEGMAGVLNGVLARWHGVRVTPSFGRWSYFVGSRLFACYPIRAKDHDLWVRLGGGDRARALGSSGVRPHRRFGTRGWIELDVTEPGELPQALKWLRRGWEEARRQAGAGE